MVSQHSTSGQTYKAKCRVALVVQIYCGESDAYTQLLDEAVRKYREEGGDILNFNTNIISEDAHSVLGYIFRDEYKTRVTEFDECYQTHKHDNDIHFELTEESLEYCYGTGPIYFEIHDTTSHHIRFTSGDLLPDGVSSLKVK